LVKSDSFFELLGFVIANAKRVYSSNLMIGFSSKELFIIRKIISLFNEAHINRTKDILSKDRFMYNVFFLDPSDDFNSDKIMDEVRKANTKGKKAFLRGVFLGCGIVSTPPSFHLELRLEKPSECSFVSNVISQFKIKHSTKTDRIYISGRENIKEFFYVIGANSAYLEFEKDAALKSISNNANRIANFEFANLKRLTKAASSHLQTIKSLLENGVLDKLPSDLKEVAYLRYEFPYLSLRELSKISNGKWTKQEIYYRLKKLKDYGKQEQD